MISFLKQDVHDIVSFLEQEGLTEEADDVDVTADCDSEILALFIAVHILRINNLSYDKNLLKRVYDMAVDDEYEEAIEDCQYLLQKAV
ncbi:hypothetical protein [Alloscardovia criceti]|uniref:hypothetical protein n=1 Tax=Alloscardovia criceti TaxID=356828 RepID=UPI00036CB3B1|nr:hypothetical protein [Alloscardovia criceti]